MIDTNAHECAKARFMLSNVPSLFSRMIRAAFQSPCQLIGKRVEPRFLLDTLPAIPSWLVYPSTQVFLGRKFLF